MHQKSGRITSRSWGSYDIETATSPWHLRKEQRSIAWKGTYVKADAYWTRNHHDSRRNQHFVYHHPAQEVNAWHLSDVQNGLEWNSGPGFHENALELSVCAIPSHRDPFKLYDPKIKRTRRQILLFSKPWRSLQNHASKEKTNKQNKPKDREGWNNETGPERKVHA